MFFDVMKAWLEACGRNSSPLFFLASRILVPDIPTAMQDSET
jgi:hypothetical protein